MPPWRLDDEAGSPRYAAVCPECGLRRGWSNAKRAQRHLDDLETFDFDTADLNATEYAAGDDSTCPGH